MMNRKYNKIMERLKKGMVYVIVNIMMFGYGYLFSELSKEDHSNAKESFVESKRYRNNDVSVNDRGEIMLLNKSKNNIIILDDSLSQTIFRLYSNVEYEMDK